MPANCGELVSEGEPEPEFDPNLVQVVEGSCSIEPRQGTPDEQRTFTAEVENPNPNTDVRADVHWALQEVPGRPALARTTIERIFRNSTAVARAATAPIDVDEVPDEFRSRVRAIVVPGSVSEVGLSPYRRPERVRAGPRSEGNGQHRRVADGGVVHAAGGAEYRQALARMCGGCAERSRKLSATNRRLRDIFDVFGRGV